MSLEETETLQQKYSELTQKLELVNVQLEKANRKLKEYEEKAKKAEKASKMKSLFLANMSHEIRTPLNAIEGFSRVMVETDSQEDRMNYMEIIESNNNRLLSLVNEILDLSRVENGEIIIKKEPTDLNYLMKSIKQLFKFRCPETVSLTWNKPASPVSMDTDANRLTQVFSNLISNALKHTPKGVISFGYELLSDTQEIRFFVKDTGTGIDPKFIEHIFDAYASCCYNRTIPNGYTLTDNTASAYEDIVAYLNLSSLTNLECGVAMKLKPCSIIDFFSNKISYCRIL
jgi:signal transduction histidine kinase